jgi:hypothetical protein
LEEEAIKTIMQLIREEKPDNVEKLVALTRARLSISEEEIAKCVLKLQSEGKITLKEPSQPVPEKLGAYLKTEKARWYWITMTLAVATAIIVFTIPENAFLLAYIRYVLGMIFLVLLPGFSFSRALFPKWSQPDPDGGNIDTVLRVALSVGLSLALVPLVGLILNYTPWGVRLWSITLCVLALTAVFATIAVIREHQL